MAEKKFYWLKLKEDFFEEDTIQWLEEQENGKDYCLFYLKLCLKSLKTNGILIRNVGQMLIPYDVKKLADITNTTVDTAIVAMEVFKKIGLVQVLENGEIYMTQLENMVGSESKWAQKKRSQRSKDKHEDNVLKLSSESPREIEKEKEIRERDKDIEKEIEKDNKSSVVVSNIEVFKYFEQCGFLLSAIQMDLIVADIEVYSAKWLMDAAEHSVKAGKINYNYVQGILRNWKAEGRKEDSSGSFKQDTGKGECKKYNINTIWDEEEWRRKHPVDPNAEEPI